MRAKRDVRLASSFPVVGIGASAGGLDAFKELLPGLTVDSGAAFVLLQHLDPKHASILSSLLARSTSMPVAETSDGTRIEPNHVYVIPPAVDIELTDGHIRHVARAPRPEPHLPIDLFLRTLAEAKGSQAIAVILSGTGRDGTEGCRAVRSQGGIALAQDPSSAKFTGMPQSAIAAGCADLVLPPRQLAEEIVRLVAARYVREDRPPLPIPSTAEPPAEDRAGLARIFELVKKSTGADFTSYRRTTLRRRIQRRMALRSIDGLGTYATLLENHPQEVQDLHQDFLINVTSFFRDADAFHGLRTKVLPNLLAARKSDQPFRVWVPGCATGEEAYSIAMCVVEALGDVGRSTTVQVFASDLSEAAIQKARTGIYTEHIRDQVSPDRLSRFFVEVDGRYQVSKALRDVLVFARHDLTRDPPFSRMDLVSCRNVLIYLEPPLQRRIMATLHYSLLPEGLLLLGQSETVGASSEHFTVVDRDQKVYAKRPHASPALPGRLPPAPPAATASVAVAGALQVLRRSDLDRESQRLLLSRYAPVSILVDERDEVIHFRGDAEPYLTHAQGAASLQLAKVARRSLWPELRRLLQDARESNGPQRKAGLLLRHRGRTRRLALEAIPIQVPGTSERFLLVIFDEGTRRREPSPPAQVVRGATAERRRVDALERELQALEHYQQAMQEEQESANEELQSANEEIVSSNEELQSINEEMETAKEELQSNNEELLTLNEELQHRNQELQLLHDDLDNLLASATVPLIMLGPDLVLRRATPAARSLGIQQDDVGRPLGRLRLGLEVREIEHITRSVLQTVAPAERTLQDDQGRWWRLHVRPYLTRDRRIDGAVLVLLDIDALKRNQQVIEDARDFADAIVDGARGPLLILDSGLRVRRANSAFCETFGIARAAAEGARLFELPNGLGDVPHLRGMLADVLSKGTAFDDYILEDASADARPRTLLLNARRLRQETDKEDLILLAIEDRTGARRAEGERVELLRRAEDAARSADAANRLKDEFVATASHELRGPLSVLVMWAHILGQDPLDPELRSRGLAAIERSARTQTRLIEDLLDVTRITLGKLRLDMRLLALQPIVEAALESARPAALARGVTVRMKGTGADEVVLADADRLQQVVWNLLSNAVKFTPRDGKVEVSCGRVGTFLHVTVRDDGQGIPAAFLPHVFDRFRQADGSTSRAQAGLGLGLSIVRQLVELHGGTVSAESAGEGRGSTFVVSLPVPALRLPTEESVEPVASAVATKLRSSPTPSLLGLDVLIVDDDDDGREAVRAVLEQRGATVRSAGAVADALVTFAEAIPDVLVSDIGMPLRDGYDLIREIRMRTSAHGGAVPALALTAYAAPEDRLKTAAAGFQEYLAKPAEPADLVWCVARLAGRAEGD